METPSSTSSSDRWRPGRALLLAATLIVAGEVAASAAVVRDPGRHVVDTLLARLEEPQPHRDVVLWGDSVTARCLTEAGADQEFHDLSTTQAIGIPGVLYSYRRLVATTGAPKHLVLVTIPETWQNDLTNELAPNYFETCFVRPDEVRHFARISGRWAQPTRMLGRAFLLPPTRWRRRGLRVQLNRLRGVDVSARPPLRPITGDDPETIAAVQERAQVETFVVSDLARTFLDEIALETATSNTRVHLLTAALPRSVADTWERNGYLAAYRAFLDDLAARHPHVDVADPRQFAQFADTQMYDDVHVRPQFMAGYGRDLADFVHSLTR